MYLLPDLCNYSFVCVLMNHCVINFLFTYYLLNLFGFYNLGVFIPNVYVYIWAIYDTSIFNTVFRCNLVIRKIFYRI